MDEFQWDKFHVVRCVAKEKRTLGTRLAARVPLFERVSGILFPRARISFKWSAPRTQTLFTARRVSMGLSVWRETSKKLTVCREKGKKLTVCRELFFQDNRVVCSFS